LELVNEVFENTGESACDGLPRGDTSELKAVLFAQLFREISHSGVRPDYDGKLGLRTVSG
jgi:hypothetical protein